MTVASSVEYTDIGYAVLFSVPVGVGVSMGALKATGGGLTHPIVVGSGILTALVMFLFVASVTAVGSTDTEP